MAYYVELTPEIKASLSKKGYFNYPQQTLFRDGEPLYIFPQTDYYKSLLNEAVYQFAFLPSGKIGGRGVYTKEELTQKLLELGNIKDILAYDVIRNTKEPLLRFLKQHKEAM